MLRVLLVALTCAGLSGCRGCKSPTKTKVVASDAGAGVETIQVGKPNKANPPSKTELRPDETKMISIEVRGWSVAPAKPRALKPADSRARVALAQALSGYRYAITGDNKVMINPHTPATVIPHTITRSKVIGMDQAMIRLSIPDPGGHATMATGKMMIGKIKPTAVHINNAKLDALRRIAKEMRGSGQILPIKMGEPRIDDGMLLMEISARVFRDGAP